MDFKEKISQIFTRSDGLVIDVFYELYIYISSLSPEQQYKAFRYMCENAKCYKIDEANLIAIKKHFTEEKLEKYLPKLNDSFVEKIENIIIDSSKSNVPSDVLYNEVWDIIQSSKTCKTKHEKALATFMFAYNDLVPYTPVGTGISMENDQYQTIIDSFDPSLLKQTKIIMQMKYDQKTQKASLLVEKLQKLDFQAQSVYLSIVLDMLEQKIKDELKTKIDSI